MHIGKKLAASMAMVGAVVAGGVVAAAPAGASSSDMGLGLITGHNVGAYADYNRINNADKVAPDLIYNADRNVTDGVEVDCWSDRGARLELGNHWYHTKTEYYNHLGTRLQRWAWTYAPYVDGEAGIRAGLQYCNY